MPFVIIDTGGQPLRDVAGDLIVLAAREEAARWTTRGEGNPVGCASLAA